MLWKPNIIFYDQTLFINLTPNTPGDEPSINISSRFLKSSSPVIEVKSRAEKGTYSFSLLARKALQLVISAFFRLLCCKVVIPKFLAPPCLGFSFESITTIFCGYLHLNSYIMLIQSSGEASFTSIFQYHLMFVVLRSPDICKDNVRHYNK